MKFTVSFCILFALASIMLHTPSSYALPHPEDLNLADVQHHTVNFGNYLEKRATRKNRGKDDCKNKLCSLKLKPCPKDCLQSCGYIDSPDPCCPLLGTPTCPE